MKFGIIAILLITTTLAAEQPMLGRFFSNVANLLSNTSLAQVSPEEKADAKALSSINSTEPVSEEELAAAQASLNETAQNQTERLEEAMAALNVTEGQLDDLEGQNNLTDPALKSNMTFVEWKLFDTEVQLEKYRNIIYMENELKDKLDK